jgi:hypothetical protein
MSSTYSNLKIELMAQGENNNQWGNITNTNLGTALEQAIVGLATVSSGFVANAATLTLSDTNALQNARALVLNVTATLSGAGTLNVPAIQKPYLVFNNTSGGFALTVKVAGQTGVSIPNGRKALVYNNGTDVGEAINYLTSLTLGSALPIASGGTGSTSTTFVNAASNVTGTLPIANGGTGTTSTTFVNAATNITGTLPVANGGTGAATLTANNVVLGNGTSAVQFVAPGASGNALVSNGTTWTSAAVSNLPRVVVIADATSITMDADTTDMATQANTQAVGTLTVNAPTGTPVNGQKLMLRLRSTNVQTFSWNAIFQGGTTPLPTTSSGSSKYDYYGFIYNGTATKWQIVGTASGF